MAVERSVPPAATPQITFQNLVVPGSSQEIYSDQRGTVDVPRMEDTVCVSVGNVVKESLSNLSWALKNSRGKRICIIHVHQPAQKIPLMGARFAASSLEEQEVMAYREIEKQNMQKILDDYLLICHQMGVQAVKQHIEMDCIEKGIVELISQLGIRKLVMGAAADKHYSRKMMDLKSKKAIYVCQQAPLSCHIQFICKEHLIHTRGGSSDGIDVEAASLLLQSSPDGSYSSDGTEDILCTTKSKLDAEGCFGEFNGLLRRTQGCLSSISVSSSSSLSSTVTNASTISTISSSEIPNIVDRIIDYTIYDQFQVVMAEAENVRREAFQETVKRRKAERDATEAICRAEASESLYAEESKQRKEIEEVRAKEKEEHEKVKNQLRQVMEELRISQDHKSLLESQIAESQQMVKGLELRIGSVVELMQIYKRERDELQMERDIAVEELKRKQGEGSCSSTQFFCEFLLSDIEEATRNFDPSLRIGKGGYGSIYKGLLRHTQVAIKIPESDSEQGPSEFQQEVRVLSKLKHPNLVRLIGSCPKAWALIYEYLPNGTLEDRLNCKDNSPPLSWQTRIRITTELCSVLSFLHSGTVPHGDQSIVHGDLKPSNILLDANFVSKLSDFGICRILVRDISSSNDTILFHRTDAKGSFAYMDPEFQHTGVLTVKSDVYSFGIILLQLLTGKPAFGIKKGVQNALDAGNLKALLDPSAGDWPFVQAEQLVRLALRCCDMYRRNRPDLGSEVCVVLEPMRASFGYLRMAWC